MEAVSRSTLGTDGAGTLLARASAFRHLKRLDLSENYLTELQGQAGATALSATKVIAEGQRTEDEPGARYAAVGE
jgi:hypothetical protein